MKYGQELIGMHGGPVRPPVTEMSAQVKAALRADLAAIGLIDRADHQPHAAE